MTKDGVEVQRSILELDAAAWDSLDHGGAPFTRHAFLAALEASGSVGPGTGWTPCPVLAWQGGRLVGAVPLYLKTHSQGEYVFDHGWAQAAERAGIRYYPKLVVAVPFTPATGARLLLADRDDGATARLLVSGIEELRVELRLSSVHWLFVDERDATILRAAGLAERHHLQYHLWNGSDPDGRHPTRDWPSFETMLEDFRGPRRREVRRERRLVADAGVEVRMEQGEELSAECWLDLDRFYRSTVERKWGAPYLSERFLPEIRRRMPERVVVAAGRRGGRLVGAALCYREGSSLFGRTWGCDEEVPGLHFECCCYTPWSWALAHGVQRFEAGAQGEHKIARGFLPRICRSFHQVAHPGLDAAVREHLRSERAAVAAALVEPWATGPFRV